MARRNSYQGKAGNFRLAETRANQEALQALGSLEGVTLKYQATVQIGEETSTGYFAESRDGAEASAVRASGIPGVDDYTVIDAVVRAYEPKSDGTQGTEQRTAPPKSSAPPVHKSTSITDLL